MIDPAHPDYTNTPVSVERPNFGYIPLYRQAKPVVTIVTPFFNAGFIFHETVQSVLHQSFQQWEWIIINDGSTDTESLATLEQYRNYDLRIRVIDQENAGPSAARNIGFLHAVADIVMQLDADDLIEPTTIEKRLWCATAMPAYSFVNSYSVGFGWQEYLWEKGFHTSELLLTENVITMNCLMRKSVHKAVGGYDESLRKGFEDWDFWLKCAAHGHWGKTIPEYHDWYRRRESHNAQWSDWDAGERQQAFISAIREKYARLWTEGLPQIAHTPNHGSATIDDTLPFTNELTRTKPRLLMILPWTTMGGADKFNLDLLKLLVENHGYEVTIVTTLPGKHDWLPVFSQYTPDIFPMHHFLPLEQYPQFLWYVIQSRRIDTVLISNSYLGYSLLPYLRMRCPDVTFIDYIHMEEESWRNGGYPRESLVQDGQLDLSIVSSQHLKQWMIERGGDATRIEVSTTNIDVHDWSPDRYDTATIRQELNIALETPVLLYAGRICEQKQPKVFAKVIDWLAQKYPDFVCLVAGNGPDLPYLQAFAAEHQLFQLRFLGQIPNQRIRELLAISDIFFLPSQMEGISLAIYEAMAMRVVPVGADVGGQAELVTSECGILVQHGPDEVQNYVQALYSLLSNPKQRQLMAQSARSRIEAHFQLPQMGHRMVELFGHAKQLATQYPCAQLPQSVAKAIAIQVVEHAKQEQVLEEMWRGHRGSVSLDFSEEMQHSSHQPEHVNSTNGWEAEARRLSKLFVEQQAWTKDLEQAKEWLDTQRLNWKLEAEQLAGIVAEQQKWIRMLEAAKGWHAPRAALQVRANQVRSRVRRLGGRVLRKVRAIAVQRKRP